MGMMPHPERASDPLMGSSDGLMVFESLLRASNLVAHDGQAHRDA